MQKVFEVIIHVNGFDSILRPSMTTKNSIITEIIDSVLFVPIESVNIVDTINLFIQYIIENKLYLAKPMKPVYYL